MNLDNAALRTKMVDCQLRTTDVTQTSILDAMSEVPREAFVPAKLKPLAYIDEDLEIQPPSRGTPGRYIMEPSPFARLLQLAEIGQGDFVLDVGAGTGYSSAVLSRLASAVVALESDETLAESADRTLSVLGFDNVAVVQGQLTAGYRSQAPYDVIVIEGAVDVVPQDLLAQLRDGGRLVAVVGLGNAGTARVFIKERGAISSRNAFNCAVRPLPGFQVEAAFQF